MKKIILLFFIVLFINKISRAQEGRIKLDPFTYSLKSLWNIDSCGNLGYRWEIVKRLCDYDIFKGKDTAYIQNLLGKPDTIYFYENDEIKLIYSIRKLRHEGCCCETVLHEGLEEFYITVNKRGKVKRCKASTDTYNLERDY